MVSSIIVITASELPIDAISANLSAMGPRLTVNEATLFDAYKQHIYSYIALTYP